MVRLLLGIVIGVAAVLALPQHARAQSADPAQTTAAMEDYFAGEQRGGITLVALGVGGLVAGGLLYRASSSTLKGASYPLLGVGLLHVAAGIFVYVASDDRIDDFRPQIDDDAAAFVDRESARMQGVSTQFTVLKIVEVVLIVGGLGTAAYAHRTDRPYWKGAGLALALEAALTLGFDIWAARRAHEYRDQLAALDVSASLEPDEPSVMIVRSGRF